MRIIMLVLALMLLAGAHTTLAAQGKSQTRAPKERTATVVITTSSQCGMCKTTIEKGLSSFAGVQSAVLNVSNQKVRVRYYRNQTNPDAIRAQIASLGYSADEVPADPKAYANLPGCCQLPGTGGQSHQH